MGSGGNRLGAGETVSHGTDTPHHDGNKIGLPISKHSLLDVGPIIISFVTCFDVF